ESNRPRPGPPLPDAGRTGRGLAAVPRRPADPGAADEPGAARLAVVPAEPVGRGSEHGCDRADLGHRGWLFRCAGSTARRARPDPERTPAGREGGKGRTGAATGLVPGAGSG